MVTMMSAKVASLLLLEVVLVEDTCGFATTINIINKGRRERQGQGHQRRRARPWHREVATESPPL